MNDVYDLLGIGVGPFNLSLAALVQPIANCKTIFFEQNKDFNWHPDLMLDFSSLQTPFMSDLVTLADPCSEFSYLNYAKKTGNLYSFYIKEDFFLKRAEYNAYCQWVVSRLNNLAFTSKVEAAVYLPTEKCYQVNVQTPTGDSFFYAKNLVVGVGTKPIIPDFCPKSPNIMHSGKYLSYKDKLLNCSNILIIGSGQSAAEVFYDLLLASEHYAYKLTWCTRSPRFFPLEYTKLTLELTSPDYIDYFYSLPEAKRVALVKTQSSLYKGINSSLINDIYDLLYDKKQAGKAAKVELRTNMQATEINVLPETINVDFLQTELNQTCTIPAEFVILGTGYQNYFPSCLTPIKDSLNLDANNMIKLHRNYSADNNNSVFMQNLGLHTHGLTAPDLGMSCYRNSVILNAILGYEPYKIETKIAFQDFNL